MSPRTFRSNYFCLVLGITLVASALPTVLPAQDPAALARRQAFLDHLLRTLPRSESWEQWLRHTGELPPDFDALPANAYLPDPIRFTDGKLVKQKDWLQRRQELVGFLQYYLTGIWPGPPDRVRVDQLKDIPQPGARRQELTLKFGPRNQARLNIELIIPPGQGPFPVVLAARSERRWATTAASRGFLGCVIHASDGHDDTEKWKDIWPDWDWTVPTRRAWAASRCIDFLQTQPFVDTNRIAIVGHRLSAKSALIAAAYDLRIHAVVASSSGLGGACPWRLHSEAYFGPGIEQMTRRHPDWFHPRLRFFAGRENKMPFDQESLLACIAPRSCLIASAANDPEESLWAVEQAYYTARRAYNLLGRSVELNLDYRVGRGEVRPADLGRFIDWLQTVFGMGTFPFPDVAVYPLYPVWLKRSGEHINPKDYPTNGLNNLLLDARGLPIRNLPAWLEKRQQIQNRIGWALGEPPPHVRGPGDTQTEAEARHLEALLDRDQVPFGISRQRLRFGNYIPGDLYYPADADRSADRIPAIIWLPPFAVAQGYIPPFKRGEAPHLVLARQGFAVFAFDLIGQGARIEEARSFYFRYPRWSLFGKCVIDTLAAVDALQGISFIDPRHIYLLGYGLGGRVALHAAALDERIAGVAAVAAFTPMRLDSAAKGTGGVAQWVTWLPWQPRLGAFIGQENRIPYDFHEVLGLIAPRPALIFRPRLDYTSTRDDVIACLNEAAKAYDLYGVRPNLQFIELDDYNRWSAESQALIINRLRAISGL